MKTFFDHELKSYNTFGIDSIAKIFVIVENIEDIKTAIDSYGIPAHILGGGSNVILPQYIEGVVWHPQFLYKTHIQKGDSIFLTIGAGENRHNTVLYTIMNGRRGIENLIAIPGNVGASPVQNIGAYGVELQDVFIQCTVYNIDTQQIEILTKEQCHFGYRHSIFKEKPGVYMVIDITLRLSLKETPIISYKPIIDHFTNIGVTQPTQKEIATVIEEIRWSKLPKPEILGNCGSFFQNPIISKQKLDELLVTYPNIPHYTYGGENYKLSAAWLIDTSGLKGYKSGDVETYNKQPLVIVNHGNATKDDIMAFSSDIIAKVDSIFGVTLQREVNMR